MEGLMFVAIILRLLSALGSIEPLEVQLISVLLPRALFQILCSRLHARRLEDARPFPLARCRDSSADGTDRNLSLHEHGYINHLNLWHLDGPLNLLKGGRLPPHRRW